MSKKIKIVVVDDHILVRFAIIRLLESNLDFKIVGQADSGEASLKIIDESKPDLILLDINMPGMGGLETIRRLQKRKPNLKIMALTAFIDAPIPSKILQAGAIGYLTKQCSPDEMFNSIYKVMQGECYLAPEVAHSLAMKNLNKKGGESPFEQLSEREMQVMLMVTHGLEAQQISERLCLSTKTVNTYRYRIFDKLKVRNNVELTHLAIQHGVLDSEKVFEQSLNQPVSEE